MTSERHTAFVTETVVALRREIARHTPDAPDAAADLPTNDPKTVDALLDVLVAHAPRAADEWRLSSLEACDDLPLTEDEISEHMTIVDAIDAAFERAAGPKAT